MADTFDEIYMAQTSFFDYNYALAASLLPNSSAIEIHKRICWARLKMISPEVVEAAKAYINIEREDAYKHIRECIKPYLNLPQILQFLKGDIPCITDPYTKRALQGIERRLSLERHKGIFVSPAGVKGELEKFTASSYSTRQVKWTSLYPFALGVYIGKTLDALWVLCNCINIEVNSKYVQPKYTSIMHSIDFAKLDQMKDVTICLQNKRDGNFPYYLVLEQCPPDSFSYKDGKVVSRDRVGEPARFYNVCIYNMERAHANIAGDKIVFKLISGKDRLYFTKVAVDYFRRQYPESIIPLSKTVTAISSFGEDEVLYGFRFSRIDELPFLNESEKALIHILFEATHQYGMTVERTCHTQTEGQATAEIPTLGTAVNTKPSEKSVSLRSLIHYVYKGERPVGTRRGGTHSSPCEHTRKGHIRRYKSGKVVMIKPMVINKGKGTKRGYSLSNPKTANPTKVFP